MRGRRKGSDGHNTRKGERTEKEGRKGKERKCKKDKISRQNRC